MNLDKARALRQEFIAKLIRLLYEMRYLKTLLKKQTRLFLGDDTLHYLGAYDWGCQSHDDDYVENVSSVCGERLQGIILVLHLATVTSLCIFIIIFYETGC